MLHVGMNPLAILTNVFSRCCVPCTQEPAFDILRTKQQLGYVVFAYAAKTQACGTNGAVDAYFSDASLSLNVLVQGANHTADDLDNRISNFLVRVAGAVPRAVVMTVACFHRWDSATP